MDIKREIAARGIINRGEWYVPVTLLYAIVEHLHRQHSALPPAASHAAAKLELAASDMGYDPYNRQPPRR